MSMHRAFPARIVPGERRRAASVECHKCGATDHVGTQTGGKNLPPDAIARKFRERGWHIGHTPAKDRCPVCNGSARSNPTTEEIRDVGLHNETAVVELRAPKPGASEAAPREMSREDRRIIFVKLEEVYVDEATGYTAGWNDHRVAEDLNCPRAWVEVIRDENFGPQRADQSAEVVELRARLDVIERDGAALAEIAATILRTAEDARMQGAQLQGRSRDLLKQAEAIRADLKKLVGGR